MIKFKTAYAVQIFNGAVESRRYTKVECKSLEEANKVGDEAAAAGKLALVWSSGGLVATKEVAS